MYVCAMLLNYMKQSRITGIVTKFPFNFREDICVKQTEDTFAPAVTSLYINAKGIDKSEKAQEQVIFQWKKN